MRRFLLFFVSILIVGSIAFYISEKNVVSTSAKENTGKKNDSVVNRQKDIREQLFDSLVCDGFDFPIGDKDGKVTPSPSQPVYAIADGTVLYTDEDSSLYGKMITIEHHYIENGEAKIIFSLYIVLNEMNVKKGDRVKRRQKIANIGSEDQHYDPTDPHFELYDPVFKTYSSCVSPNVQLEKTKEYFAKDLSFINSHRKLNIPAQEAKFAVVVKHEFKCYYYTKGKLQRTFEIALGQEPIGQKEKQGDLKVPEGEYKICEKTRGPFDTTNWVNAFLGTRWLRLNYPNAYDAERGLKNKWITQGEHDKIVAAAKQNKMPPKTTAMGGGIGFHGWVRSEWDNNSPRAQTWGCVSFHNKDLEEFFELADMNMIVVITP